MGASIRFTGHIAYLTAAAGQGDFLIVNMPTDQEIWEKRSPIGPFLLEDVRKPVSKVTVWLQLRLPAGLTRRRQHRRVMSWSLARSPIC